jgi:hypothetical protein
MLEKSSYETELRAVKIQTANLSDSEGYDVENKPSSCRDHQDLSALSRRRAVIKLILVKTCAYVTELAQARRSRAAMLKAEAAATER